MQQQKHKKSQKRETLKQLVGLLNKWLSYILHHTVTRLYNILFTCFTWTL